jgi:hypothetical protein
MPIEFAGQRSNRGDEAGFALGAFPKQAGDPADTPALPFQPRSADVLPQACPPEEWLSGRRWAIVRSVRKRPVRLAPFFAGSSLLTSAATSDGRQRCDDSGIQSFSFFVLLLVLSIRGERGTRTRMRTICSGGLTRPPGRAHTHGSSTVGQIGNAIHAITHRPHSIFARLHLISLEKQK